MKQKVIYIALVILSISLLSCSDEPINKITVQNNAAGDVYLNFRGTQVTVLSGQSVVLEDIDKGEYEYETIYSLPAGATSSSTDGDMAGTFTLRAGTKIMVIYSSIFEQGGSYKISVSITNSDNLSEEGILPDPIGP